MPATSCKEAIKKWEAANNMSPSEATEARLYCQIPPMDKMDDSLNQFENVTRLSLSTNAIERMIALPKLKNLKILSLGRNNIKRIMALEEVGQSLEELWLSYNQIEKLDGLQPCNKLHTLFLGCNRVKSWEEVSKVSQLHEIKTVLFLGNPIYGDRSRDENAPLVVKKIPQIETLDGKMISASIRSEAEAMD
uniref:Dynein axonemal light chain 1 n=1 Tax=Strombidinopsis acuminata TaxID=141414 RepID=A0A7S3SAH7_9SPIT|mmetsp:Transcript_26010/g.35439  ORF Transcript_26010/g.35439 Transcript_26010/m.35439 type:complete len:192 (+) Transcript_26010:16-591(+)|eukprot:CAMPEP_0176360182 /NCGR_PEP_ID=MMETSP0126-20121128/16924_1 /TAXON_ID=141414 ORGANISM="Strombidinopsis acuminatum, Strain SPMC142" /NCGR_SAMPLE_ID=MMETSP0126 /ASSEMBLY_ACC=CAM_ASM_000229 /LENGTH=191 /DNA_ID=CAMNT_0017715347 /DNA_START=15 /DNA_END=590 /DNA_ORIENTATION=-